MVIFPVTAPVSFPPDITQSRIYQAIEQDEPVTLADLQADFTDATESVAEIFSYPEVSAAVCGDLICEVGEDPLSCPADCLLGPSSYFEACDSGFDMRGLGDEWYLENFEDGALNVPGVTNINGAVLGPGAGADSVDGDDGAVDGIVTTTAAGISFFHNNGPTGISFIFDPNTFGPLQPPTAAGIVWTDGSGTITFEAFSDTACTVSLGTVTHPVSGGAADEDRFFGVIDRAGIGCIHIENSFSGIEVDHLQYGLIDSLLPNDCNPAIDSATDQCSLVNNDGDADGVPDDCIPGLVCGDGCDGGPEDEFSCGPDCGICGDLFCDVDLPADSTCPVDCEDFGGNCDATLSDPPVPELLAWWDGSNSSGTTALDIIGGHHGTLTGTASSVPGLNGDALGFDDESAVVIPDNPALVPDPVNGVTIEGWVRYAISPAYGEQLIFSDRHGCLDYESILLSSERAIINTADSLGTRQILPLTPQMPGVWNHYAFTWDSTSGMNVYINGVLDASLPGGTGSPWNSPQPFTIGALKASYTNCFGAGTGDFAAELAGGEVDELTYYNRALTLLEIQDIYDAVSPGKCKPDADADGIVDSLDACPNSPPASVVNDVGCPDAACLPFSLSEGGADFDGSLVTWWTGDTDASDYVSGYDGTFQGSATVDPSGFVDGAFEFDATSLDYVEMPLLNVTDLINPTFTYSFWANPGTVSDRPTWGFAGSSTSVPANPFGNYDR